MNKIDVTKPIQFVDGTPAVFREIYSTTGEFAGDIVLDEPHAGRCFKANGEHRYRQLPDIENVPEPTFDPSKPVQTRDGRPARVLCTDASGSYPIAALINGDLRTYTSEGLFVEDCGEDTLDLVNIPEETVEYVNVYERGWGGDLGGWVAPSTSSKGSADRAAGHSRRRLACLKVTSVNGKRTSVEIA